MENSKYDISGYATKNDVLCTDGRIIRHNAFVEDDGKRVPLLWHHMHGDPKNVLGHAILENREDGVYTYVKFNDSETAKHAKAMVANGDVNSFSIFATKLIHSGADVIKGVIQEVSLVLTGANKEAKIDNVSFRHSDGNAYESDDEVIMYFGNSFKHEDGETEDPVEEIEEVNDEVGEVETEEGTEENTEGTEEVVTEGEETLAHEEATDDTLTLQQVYDSMTEIQQDVVNALVYQAAGGTASVQHSDLEGDNMNNLFENQNEEQRETLSHADFLAYAKEAQDNKTTLRTVLASHDVLAHAEPATYGIENIDYLFPDHKYISDVPTLVSRDMSWVAKIMGGTKKTPFSRIKSIYADVTEDEARALGYIKGKLKKEEVFKLLKRTTSPTTIYKKQKLDRDDILDIIDINVVMFLKQEMQLMLREEQARAIVLGDGRDSDSADKIKDPAGDKDGVGIRSIYHDDALYAHRTEIITPVTDKDDDFIVQVLKARKNYKGKAKPAMLMGTDMLTDLITLKDKIGRRYYETEAALATALGVTEIIEIGLMDDVKRTDGGVEWELNAIMVNLNDYVVGENPGARPTMFEDFDIDYNQYKYLIETRFSGALKDPKTAIIFETKKPVVEG